MFLEGVPINPMMQVILPILLGVGAAHAHTDWRDTAKAAVVDPLGLELALQRAEVDARAASVLAGDERWRKRGARMDQETALTWARIVGPSVLAEGEATGWTGREHCARIKGHDPVPGDRAVVLYPGRPTNDSVGEAPPSLVLASQDGHEYAFARLLPGDSVQVVDGLRRGQRTERIEYRRGEQTLTIERTGTVVEACYGRGEG
jgi:hypothetical protein